MKKNLLISICAGLLLCTAGIMTAQGAITNAYISFRVDMSSNLVAGTFNPPTPAIIGGISYGGTGTDTVYARGIFDAWANPGFQLVQVGTSGVYTNTVDDTATQDLSDGNANFQYACYENGTLTDEDGSGSGWANRSVYLPTTNNGVVVVPTSFFNDSGPATTNNITFQVDMSEQIELGAFHPSSGDNVVVAGSYENFVVPPGTPSPFLVSLTNNPNILITNNNFSPPVVESNVWVGTGAIYTDSAKPIATVGCNQQFKYVIEPEGDWDSPQFPNMDVYSGNRFYTMSGDQTLPLVSFSDLPYLPVANVTLNVDMSGPIKYDPDYVPNSVQVWGSFNGWATNITMTSNPAPNTNIFTSPSISMPEDVPVIIQVRYTNSVVAANNPTQPWVYDYANDSVYNDNARRTITLPLTATALTTNMPSFYFLDLAPDDYLLQATPVLFSVDMNGAVATNGTAFNPSSDSVYINGMFANGGGTPYPQAWYPWSGGANPLTAPPGYQMIREGSTTIYTNTIIIPPGTPVAVSYQYGMDPGSVYGGPLEDEAATGANHFRVVRSTAGNLYTMPADTFTNQPYQEPLFALGNIYEGMGTLAGGNLTVGAASGGTVPVSWLGRPGAHLQTKSSLSSGSWQDLWATDGTNWNAGTYGVNGLVSQTNYPITGGTTYFRLVKP